MRLLFVQVFTSQIARSVKRMLCVNNQPVHLATGSGNSEQGRRLPKFPVADFSDSGAPSKLNLYFCISA
jgi:hypothetical protein